MYTNLNGLLSLAEERGAGLWEIILENEQSLYGMSKEEIFDQLKKRYEVMEYSSHEALEKPFPAKSSLIKGVASAQNNYSLSGGICGGFINRAMALALSSSEVNASMGRICAAPTAGACGILPAVLISMREKYSLSLDETIKGLMTASGICAVIMTNATVAGAEGGCQAECGVAAAISASAAVTMAGGTPRMAINACSLALMNVMGLICDPVAGLVQVPCAQRNASQTINALLSADLALGGMESLIPADEVIESMYRVGKQLPMELRETAMGGIASTQTAKEIEMDILEDKYQ